MARARIFMNNFTAGELSPAAWARVDLSKYQSGLRMSKNTLVRPHGGVSFRGGLRFINEVPGPGRKVKFTYSVTQAYALLFLDRELRIYQNGGAVVDPATGEIVSIPSPYSLDELFEIRFAQSADVMFLTHPAHPPTKLTRSDHHIWNFEEIQFLPDIDAPQGLTAAPHKFEDPSGTYRNTTVSYKVSAVNEREKESLPSDEAEADIISPWPVSATVALEWEPVTDAVRYEVYKNARGWFEWIGSTEKTEFTDDNIEGDTSTGPKENRNPFEEPEARPGVVGIYQQRLTFGRSNREPQTVWGSETGAFDSMAVATPLRADSAFTATIDSRQMNEIRHFVPMKDIMLIFTSGAEVAMGPGKNTDAVTPTSIRFDFPSQWGVSIVPPEVVGNSILMVQNSGRVVRDLYYQIASEGYDGNDISILAEHLLVSPIVDWSYQQDPNSIVWCCRQDGVLLALTYMREQEIWAWSHMESEGARFLSVTAVREGAKDRLYLLVERWGRYFVEILDDREYGTPVEDSFFVDCGLSYSGDPTRKITGLDHLAGRKVSTLLDGSVYKDIVVNADGTLELPVQASKVQVGLGYEFLMETLDPDLRSETGTAAGLKKNIPNVTVEVRESRDLWVGPSVDDLTEFKLPNPDRYTQPPPLMSGRITDSIRGDHREFATLVIRHTDPLPLTILGLIGEVTVADG